MGIKTEIAWCDSTVNPVMGCDGCELSGGHCYAESLVTRYAGLKGWPKTFKRPEFVGTIRRLDAGQFVGKHAAGRMLDGREWVEFPQASSLKPQASNGPHRHLQAGP